jgi:hypothetical protein
MGGAIRAVTAVVLLAAFARAADVRVLTPTGVRLDGFGIAAIEQPTQGGGAVVFRGVRTSIDVVGRTIASGDPLPASLAGTFEEIQWGATAGEIGAVLSATNGPDAAWGIFLVEGATMTPAVTVGSTDDASLRRFAMNASGDIAYGVRAAHGTSLFVRTHATGTSAPIAGPDKNLTLLRGFAMDLGGAVAWMDRRGRVSHWDPTHGLRDVEAARYPSGGGRRALELDATYGLVYVTREAVKRWDPATGQSVVLLAQGTRIDGRRLRLRGDVGFRDDGAIVVRAVGNRYACIGARVELCGGPVPLGPGQAVGPRREAGVFRVRANTMTTVVRPGDALTDVGALADVVAHAADDATVAFIGVLPDGRSVLGRVRGGALETLAVDGPIGNQTLALGDSIVGVRGRLVAVNAIFSDADGNIPGNQLGIGFVKGPGTLSPVFGPQKKRYQGLLTDEAVLSGGRLVALVHGPKPFVAGGRRTKPVGVAGELQLDPADGVDSLAATPDRVVFVARGKNGDVGLHELLRSGSRRIVGLPAVPTFLAAGGDDVAFTVSTEDGDELWLVRDEVAAPLVRAGDPTPLGTITSFDSLGVVGTDVVFTATLAGDGARHALLAVARR